MYKYEWLRRDGCMVNQDTNSLGAASWFFPPFFNEIREFLRVLVPHDLHAQLALALTGDHFAIVGEDELCTRAASEEQPDRWDIGGPDNVTVHASNHHGIGTPWL